VGAVENAYAFSKRLWETPAAAALASSQFALNLNATKRASGRFPQSRQRP